MRRSLDHDEPGDVPKFMRTEFEASHHIVTPEHWRAVVVMSQDLAETIVHAANDRFASQKTEPGDASLVVLGALRQDLNQLPEKLKVVVQEVVSNGHTNGNGLRSRAQRAAPPMVAGGGIAAIIFELIRMAAGG